MASGPRSGGCWEDGGLGGLPMRRPRGEPGSRAPRPTEGATCAGPGEPCRGGAYGAGCGRAAGVGVGDRDHGLLALPGRGGCGGPCTSDSAPLQSCALGLHGRPARWALRSRFTGEEAWAERRSHLSKVMQLVSGSAQHGTQDRPAAEPAFHPPGRCRLLREGEVVGRAYRQGKLGSRLGTTTNPTRDLGLNPFSSLGLGFSTCEIEVVPALPATSEACMERQRRSVVHVDLLCK